MKENHFLIQSARKFFKMLKEKYFIIVKNQLLYNLLYNLVFIRLKEFY